MTRPFKKLTASILCLVAGLWLFWGFGYETAWKFLLLQVNGTIVQFEFYYEPAHGFPGNTMVYYLKTEQGKVIIYLAGPGDASLPRSMLPGSVIDKNRWSYEYTIDGKTERFPVFFYGSILVTGFVALILGLVGLIQELIAQRKRANA